VVTGTDGKKYRLNKYLKTGKADVTELPPTSDEDSGSSFEPEEAEEAEVPPTKKNRATTRASRRISPREVKQTQRRQVARKSRGRKKTVPRKGRRTKRKRPAARGGATAASATQVEDSNGVTAASSTQVEDSNGATAASATRVEDSNGATAVGATQVEGKAKTKQAKKRDWIKSYSPALAADQHARLPLALRDMDVPVDDGLYYRFAHRVCKEYKGHMENKVLQDDLHSHRDTLVANCVSQVFTEVRPRSVVPHGGDEQAAVIAILPVVEKVFNMPPAGPKFGSPEWMSNMCKGRIPIVYAAKFPNLMKKLVRKLIKRGNKKPGLPAGYPILQMGKRSLLTMFAFC
jgi:hypothetical protein